MREKQRELITGAKEIAAEQPGERTLTELEPRILNSEIERSKIK